MATTILVTGGAGYIGSHCILTLLESGYEVIAIDNFANAAKGIFFEEKNLLAIWRWVSLNKGSQAKPDSLLRVETLTSKKIVFYEVDIQEKCEIRKVFREVNIFFFFQFII